MSKEEISAGERRREKAVAYARASVGLEGFKPHKADDELARQYVAGAIKISDAIKAVHDSIRER
jgi:Antitoxin VbhA